MQGWRQGLLGPSWKPRGQVQGQAGSVAGCQRVASLKLGTAAGRGFRRARPHLAPGTLGRWAGRAGNAKEEPGPRLRMRACAHTPACVGQARANSAPRIQRCVVVHAHQPALVGDTRATERSNGSGDPFSPLGSAGQRYFSDSLRAPLSHVPAGWRSVDICRVSHQMKGSVTLQLCTEHLDALGTCTSRSNKKM